MTKPAVDRSLFEHLPLFDSLNKPQIQRIVATTRVVEVQEDERLFSRGQPAEYFYLVVSGHVKLSRVSADGQEKIIELISEGRLFGEAIVFFDERRCPVDATALTGASLYGFHIRTYYELLKESSKLAIALCADLSKRLGNLIEEVDRLSLQNASLRVVGYLDALAPKTNAESAVIQLTVPKQVIAARLSITPETFSRIMRTLTEEGLITIHGKTVGVHDLNRLRKFAHNGSVSYASR